MPTGCETSQAIQLRYILSRIKKDHYSKKCIKAIKKELIKIIKEW